MRGGPRAIPMPVKILRTPMEQGKLAFERKVERLAGR